MSVALIVGLLVLVLIAGIAVSQRSGPRITTVERRTERKDEGE